MHSDEHLTDAERKVLREGGTEAPYSGKYLDHNEQGTYVCVGCGAQLFGSGAKFTTNIAGLKGWPSFDDALPGAVEFRDDTTLGMHRTEVVCAKCGGHLGHVFDDESETDTGKHYCINSTCLGFTKEES